MSTPLKKSSRALLKELSTDKNENTWLLQPTVLTFMKHDYTLMQNKIYHQVIDKLQFAVKEAITNYKSTNVDDATKTSLFTTGDYDDPDNPDSLRLKIHISEFGVARTSYSQLKDALRTISCIPVEIPYEIDGRPWMQLESLCSIRMPKEFQARTDFIYIIIKKRTANCMLSIKSGYTKYLKQTVTNSRNSYTPRLYTLLSLYKGMPSKKIKTRYLRQLLCVEDKYKIWRDFRVKILESAYKDLKRMCIDGIADFYFEWENIYGPDQRKAGEPETIMFTFHGADNPLTQVGQDTLIKQQKYIYDLLRGQLIMMDEKRATEIQNRITLDNYKEIQESILYIYDYLTSHPKILRRGDYMYSSLDKKFKELGETINKPAIPSLFDDEYTEYEEIESNENGN